MAGNSVRLHRVLRAKPEKVYRAFLTPKALEKWLPPKGFTAEFHQLEPKVGGRFRASFTNFTTELSHSFGGQYLELVPDKRLRYTDQFEDPNMPNTMNVTVNIQEVSCGCELDVTQEGIPDAIPVEMCYLGWQESLEALAFLVEPDIRE
jgi:uncharacterized protein YndB with AHSA1/START domain